MLQLAHCLPYYAEFLSVLVLLGIKDGVVGLL